MAAVESEPEAVTAQVRFTSPVGNISVYVPNRSPDAEKTISENELSIDLAGEVADSGRIRPPILD